MADRPNPIEDVLHVAVGMTVLGINRFHQRRHQLEAWLDRLATELAADGDQAA